MLLGKRPRPHIRRTTSMTGFPSNVEMLDSNHHPDDQDHQHLDHCDRETVITNHNHCDRETVITNHNYVTSSSTTDGYVCNGNNSNYYNDHGRYLASMVLSPRNVQQHHRSSSSGGFVIDPPNFLRSCGFCGRRLSFGRDIYMGDTAFCSQECREKRMEQDERNDKYNKVIMATK